MPEPADGIGVTGGVTPREPGGVTPREPGGVTPREPGGGTPREPGGGISGRERIALAVHRGLDRRLSPFGVWVMRRTRGGVARPWKVDALLLTTRGRRTGRERTVVLQFFPDGDAMILAAANDGGASHPGWYHNLVAAPEASVEVEGCRIAVRAEVLSGEAAAAGWRRVVAGDPSYERYARAAGARVIPLVRLVPRGDAGLE